jgi:hypothetical protein
MEYSHLRIAVKRYLLILICAEVLIFAGLFINAYTRHIIRIKISSDIKDFYWNPPAKPSWFRFEEENTTGIDDFRNIFSSLANSKGSDLEKFVAIMNWVSNRGARNSPASHLTGREDPRDLLRNLMDNKAGYGGCGHYGLIFSVASSSAGLNSRVWGIGFGKRMHTVTEGWCQELNKWVVFDVFDNSYYTRDNIPLSLFELRNIKLKGEEGHINIISTKEYYSRDVISRRLLQHIRDIALITSSDYFTTSMGNNHARYGWLGFMGDYLNATPIIIQKIAKLMSGRDRTSLYFVDNNISIRRVVMIKYAINIALIIFVVILFAYILI